jgi:hypothetical protein
MNYSAHRFGAGQSTEAEATLSANRYAFLRNGGGLGRRARLGHPTRRHRGESDLLVSVGPGGGTRASIWESFTLAFSA